MNTHVRVEWCPVGDAATEVPHDTDDNHTRLQAGGSSLHRRRGQRGTRGGLFIAPLLYNTPFDYFALFYHIGYLKKQSNKYGLPLV